MHRDLLARVARTIRQECRVGGDDRVAVALSGGSDSVALAWLLHALAGAGGPALAGVVHVNHRLRGEESDADETFCRELAVRLNAPIVVASVDVAERAAAARTSVEVAGRDARYRAFQAAAIELGADFVATAHTEDDQAETVLLRLLRGAGTRGLSGIRARRDRVIRPVLHCTRQELRAYLTARDERWRDDSTNADVAILRNRVRHELLPAITAIAPEGVRALARIARHASDDEAVLMAEAVKNRAVLVLSDETPGRLEVDAHGLSLLPPALARRLVRALLAELAPDSGFTAPHLEAVCRLAGTDKPVGHLDLPGVKVEKTADVLVLAAAAAWRHRPDPASWPVRTLDVPGEVIVPEAGFAIEARVAPVRAGEWEALDLRRAMLQTDTVRFPLAVRNRRPGDRFRPLGSPGRRKLQDVLVDRKIPRIDRDRVAVVVDADDKIVWVAGVAVSHDCRVTAPERSVLIFRQRDTE